VEKTVEEKKVFQKDQAGRKRCGGRTLRQRARKKGVKRKGGMNEGSHKCRGLGPETKGSRHEQGKKKGSSDK